MTVLFWDIDGTLLTTGKAGVPAWEAAVREATGHEFQLASIRVAGLTDYQIAVRTFEMLGVEPDDATVRGMVRRYEELLPASLPLKRGSVLPNVREILEHLESREDVRSYLLTGNTRGGARAKLTHYRPLPLLSRWRICRGRGRACHDRRPRARAGAARRSGCGRLGVRHWRHASRHSLRQRHRCADHCRRDRWLHGRGACRAPAVACVSGASRRRRVHAADRTRSIRAGRRRCTRCWRPTPVRVQRLLRRFPRLWRATRLARRWYYARYDAYPDWQPILQANSELWSTARASAQGGPRVLMATGDRLVRPRGDARERAGGSPDVSRGGGPRAAVRRRR